MFYTVLFLFSGLIHTCIKYHSCIKVKVNYTVKGTALEGTADTGISQLEAGKRYVLTLSLGGGAAITPSLDIENWIEIQDEQDTEVDEDDKHNW